MRIDSALKNLWKRIERNIVENQVPTRRPSQPNQPRPTDTFSPGGSKARPYGEIQQPLRGAPAPKYDAETAGKIVEALYQGVLGRGVDPLGAETWIPLVQQGRLSDAIDGIVQSHEFKTNRSKSVDVAGLSESLYQGILQRGADPEGNVGTQAAIGVGNLSQRVYDMILSPEFQQVLTRKPEAPVEPTPTTPTPPTSTLPPEPGAPLATVPMRAEYAAVQVDRNNQDTAIKQAATWVRENKPQFFGSNADRQKDVEMMGWVIGILRANGYDAHRVVNHPTLHDGYRYGSDALALNNKVYDVYVGHGDPNADKPVANYVGDYGDRPRE